MISQVYNRSHQTTILFCVLSEFWKVDSDFLLISRNESKASYVSTMVSKG